MVEITIKKSLGAYPLLEPKERLKIWESVKGIWKNRKPDPAKELNKIHKERERKLPSLH